MLFDRLARIAERSAPRILNLVRQARLFILEQKAQEILPEEMSLEEQGFLYDNFFLPFEVIAVEDPVSCIILANAEKDQIGMERERMFIELLDNDSIKSYQASVEYTDHSPEERIRLEQLVASTPVGLTMNIGTVRLLPVTNSKAIAIAGNLFHSYIFNRDGGLVRDVSAVARATPQLSDSAMRNACICLQEVMYINSPGRFILERKPLHLQAAKRQKNQSRIPRSPDRPVYTILEPGKIRERMKLPTPSQGGSVEPHQRRRHFRKLNSDKFVHRKGQTVVVKACWVGPTEAVVGNHRYKVLVDL